MSKLSLDSFETVFKQAMKLIFAKEDSIRNELIFCFNSVNIVSLTPERVVSKLSRIYTKSSLTEKTCLEEIVTTLFKNGARVEEDKAMGKDSREKDNEAEILNLGEKKKGKKNDSLHKGIMLYCWTDFISNIGDASAEKREYAKASLKLLRIGCSFYSEWVFKNLKDIFGILKTWINADRFDYVVIGEMINMFSYVEPIDEHEALEVDLFLKLANYFIVKQQGTDDENWYFAASCLTKAIFKLKEHPEVHAQKLLKTLSSFLTGEDKMHSREFFGKNTSQRNFLGGFTQGKDIYTQESEFDNNDIEEFFERKLSQVMFVAGEVALSLLGECDKIET